MSESEPQPGASTQGNRPDNWVERLRDRLPDNWIGKRFDELALKVDEPTEFCQTQAELAHDLDPKSGDAEQDAERSVDLLAEAQSIYDGAEQRAAGATTRATTLQGAIAIAASLLLAGTALVLDQAKLHGVAWRGAFALLLLGSTVALVMSGLRALSATSTIHKWHRPTATAIIERSSRPAKDARLDLAAETLIAYSFNTKIAAWKVAYLGAAAWWFRVALAFLLALALLVSIYALAGPSHEAHSTTTTRAAPARAPSAPGATSAAATAPANPARPPRRTATSGPPEPRRATPGQTTP